MATKTDAYSMADALEQLESEVGGSFTWNNTEFPAVVGTRTEGKNLGAGGFGLEAGIQIVVRQELFTGALPTSKELLTVASRQYRIDSVDHSPDNALLVINCVDDTRGV